MLGLVAFHSYQVFFNLNDLTGQKLMVKKFDYKFHNHPLF